MLTTDLAKDGLSRACSARSGTEFEIITWPGAWPSAAAVDGISARHTVFYPCQHTCPKAKIQSWRCKFGTCGFDRKRKATSPAPVHHVTHVVCCREADRSLFYYLSGNHFFR